MRNKLSDAAWEVGEVIRSTNAVPRGVLIGVVGALTNTPAVLWSLVDALNAAGVESRIEYAPSRMTTLKFNGILITVGARPDGVDNQVFKAEIELEKAKRFRWLRLQEIPRAKVFEWEEGELKAYTKLGTLQYIANTRTNAPRITSQGMFENSVYEENRKVLP